MFKIWKTLNHKNTLKSYSSFNNFKTYVYQREKAFILSSGFLILLYPEKKAKIKPKLNETLINNVYSFCRRMKKYLLSDIIPDNWYIYPLCKIRLPKEIFRNKSILGKN